MDIKLHHNTLKMLLRIFNTETSTIPCIQTAPQKLSFPFEASSSDALKTAFPEDVEMSSAHLYSMVKELKESDDVALQHLTVVKNGTVICNLSFGEFKPYIWRATHSLCKSITALAIGMLADDGLLSVDQKLTDIFDTELSPSAQIAHKNTRISHLLTMTVGSTFNEAGIIASSDWLKSWFEAPVRFEAGSSFYYNSLNSYILSAIVRKKTGKNLTDFLKTRLFDKLGIKKYHWETCPKGIEKGGFGLYLCPEDMAKLGMLVAQNGKWNGEQIISEKWLKSATKPHISVPDSVGDYDYGYHIWCHRKNGSLLFNGMFGQNVFIYPHKDVVVVTLCGNCEVFQKSSLYSIVNKYFTELYPLNNAVASNPFVYRRRLFELCGKPLRRVNAPLPTQCALLCGKNITFNDGKSAGILPLIVQIMQNNYSQGINRISFSADGDDFYVNITEGVLVERIPVGFDGGKISEVIIGGESYLVSTVGSFLSDEENRLVLKLKISFLELPNERIIRFYFDKDFVLMKMDETPGKDFLSALIKSALSEQNKTPFSAVFSRFSDKIDTDYLQYRTEKIFSPTLKGAFE